VGGPEAEGAQRARCEGEAGRGGVGDYGIAGIDLALDRGAGLRAAGKDGE
jgi:hypothetical protein